MNHLRLYQRFCIVLNDYFLPFSFYDMSLGAQPGGLIYHAPRKFFIENPAFLQCPPVRRDVFFTFSSILFRRTGGNTGKNAGSYGSAKAGVMLFREPCSNLIDRNESTLRNTTHYLIDFYGSRDHAGTRAPLLAHLLADFDNFRHVFAVQQLFFPGLLHFNHSLPTIISTERQTTSFDLC